MGLILGLTFVHYINPIADGLGWVMGRPLFNPEIYYLYRIPTIVFPETAAWIVAGALGIAMLASVLPALRAARLHPVEALRMSEVVTRRSAMLSRLVLPCPGIRAADRSCWQRGSKRTIARARSRCPCFAA